MNIGRVTLVVKTSGDPAAAAPMLRDVVQQVDPFATVERMGPLEAKISASVAEPRFATFVLVTFAALALALAITGLYRRPVVQHRGAAPRVGHPHGARRDARRPRDDGAARGIDDDSDRPRGGHGPRNGRGPGRWSVSCLA